MDEVFPGGK